MHLKTRTRTSEIALYSGGSIDPINPDPALVNIEDIAHSLALSCRYTGHVIHPYTVAQHSINLSYSVSPENKLEALLHDASEAYLSDIATPIKKASDMGESYSLVEDKLYSAIAARFGLKDPLPQDVKDADRDILTYEIDYLMPDHPVLVPWLNPDAKLPLTKSNFAERDWREVEAEFTERFWLLYNDREGGTYA